MTVPISQRTREHIDALFDEGQREQVAQRLEVECADNLPLWHDKTPEGLERIRFAVLSLSGGELDGLQVYLREAQTDWRDVLISAGFGDDLEAHTTWKPSRAKRRSRCGGCCGMSLALLVAFGIWYIDPFAPEFDFERWRAENGKHRLLRHYPRRAMADRLCDSDRLIGLSRAETRALLGDPPPDEQYYSIGDQMDVYLIGTERYWPPIDS